MSRRSGTGAEAVKTLATNRRARHFYHVDDRMECGIVLRGTEVKSLKAAQFSFTDSYARIADGELLLVGLHITPYAFGNQFNHDPTRVRKLLAHRDEIRRLRRRVTERGLTLIPLRFYVKSGLVKVELGVCRGKRTFDKREDIKRRDLERDLDRQVRSGLRSL
jgi:SsrA-binding protein